MAKMVLCCVPNCGSDSWNCDSSITFHEFPPNPDLAAKWIKQINNALQKKPMWFPRGKPMICSKHFLQTDFKPDSDALKPRCLPTVFGFKYIGANPDSPAINKVDSGKSPLIVKVLKPAQNNNGKQNEMTRTTLPSQSNSASTVNQWQSFSANANKTPLRNNGYRYNKVTPSSPTKKLADHIRKQLNESGHDIASKYNTVSDTLKVNGSSAKKMFKKKRKLEEDVIEIGPNTFLKINPDVIKVNKKQTPSGNTVLQFIMDQKLASTSLDEFLPKVIQSDQNNVEQSTHSKSLPVRKSNAHNGPKSAEEPVVQHVVGHLVDTHVCKESCSNLKIVNDVEMEEHGINEEGEDEAETVCTDKNNDVEEIKQSHSSEKNLNNNSDESFMAKAPVLLTTDVPLAHCYMEKPKYMIQLKQKAVQICKLKSKIANLTKKIEELEDRVIVQERQLSYSFIKRLKVIRKNAAKGDPSATYVLEQIRAYSGTSRMRWSDSTLAQCAVWCRKAPYAYEYFKKAEFFKLPCLGTVKRYMKKHPEIKFQKKITNSEQNADDDESSSDFDFDESDDSGEKEEDEEAQESETAKSGAGETTTSKTVPQTNVSDKGAGENKSCLNNVAESAASNEEDGAKSDTNLQESDSHGKGQETAKEIPISFPVTVNSSNLELQEIILPSGEVVQCYSSSVCNGDMGGQYYIIPNVGDQHSSDHEYSVVQTDSLHILQNLEASQIPAQQEQLIFITNSTEQVECSETEVVTA